MRAMTSGFPLAEHAARALRRGLFNSDARTSQANFCSASVEPLTLMYASCPILPSSTIVIPDSRAIFNTSNCMLSWARSPLFPVAPHRAELLVPFSSIRHAGRDNRLTPSPRLRPICSWLHPVPASYWRRPVRRRSGPSSTSACGSAQCSMAASSTEERCPDPSERPAVQRMPHSASNLRKAAGRVLDRAFVVAEAIRAGFGASGEAGLRVSGAPGQAAFPPGNFSCFRQEKGATMGMKTGHRGQPSGKRTTNPLRSINGLAMLRAYKARWLMHDLVAGLSVSAVLVPACMAYAEAADLPAVNGLYASFAAMLVYATFGPSRFLIVGPDSALVALIAASVMPLSQGDPHRAPARSRCWRARSVS
jgi:hypothetical protein